MLPASTTACALILTTQESRVITADNGRWGALRESRVGINLL